ncbi:mucin-16-like isoform X2 [Erinaceus europaeus]|uniref:Mucin-16-like isoform X2 n=1 Tax=Erinaceus europaeus TaxID=9365 RepID=A0ABM3WTV6_ERIEU|nr:mucin-16-like isoform X2 [Erinaceus europaeus]
MFPGGPGMSTSQATSLGTKASSAVPTMPTSPGRPRISASQDTILGTGASSAVPATPMSFSRPGISISQTTSQGTDASSAVSATPMSPGEPGMSTSKTIILGTESSSAVPTMTTSPGRPGISTSETTSQGTESSSAVPITPTSPGGPGMSASKTTSLWTEASSAVPTTPMFPGGSGMSTSKTTILETEASSAVPTMPKSPGRPGISTSQATSLGTDVHVITPTPNVSPREPATTAFWVTHSESQSFSGLPVLPGSPEVPGVTISLATSSGEEAGTATLPILTDYPHDSAERTTALWLTSSGIEVSSTVPILNVSSGESARTASWNTDHTETGLLISNITPDVLQNESETTSRVGTTPGAGASSTILDTSLLPSVPGVATSSVTSSGTKTSTVVPTLTSSPHELETSALMGTHPETEASSAVPTTHGPPGKSETTISWVTHLTETNPTVSRTTSRVSHGASETASPVATSSTVSTLTVSPGAPGMVTSQATGSVTDTTSVVTSTQPYSPEEPTTTDFTATQPELPVSSTILTPAVSSVAASVTSVITSSESETNWTFLTGSSQEPETTATRAASSEREASSTAPTLTVSTGGPNATTLWPTSPTDAITHPGTEASSAMPAPTVFSPVPELVTKLVTIFGAETSTTASVLTDSPYAPDTIASEGETKSATPALTGLPDTSRATTLGVTLVSETRPTVLRTTPIGPNGESDTTLPVTKTSSTMPISIVTSGVPASMTSKVMSSEVTTATRTMSGTHTTDLAVTHLSAEVSTTISGPFPETTPSSPMSPKMEANTTLPALTTKPSLTTTLVMETSQAALGSTLGVPTESPSLSTETGTVISASTLSPGFSETTSYLYVTSPASEASTGSPSLTIFPGGLQHVSTSESYTVAATETETSPPTTSVEYPEFKTIPGNTVPLVTSETPRPSKPQQGQGLSLTTVLQTSALRTTDLTAISSRPTGTKMSATSSSLVGSSVAPLSTAGMSTSASVNVTPETTAVPFLLPFSINFTITNLHYQEDMGNSDSEIFSATERHLQLLLAPLLQNSTVGSLYRRCTVSLLRADKNGRSTRVGTLCTYQPAPTGFRLDREQLYWELSQQTHGVTQLGPYTLDPDSLYVNGYNHRYGMSTANGTGPALAPFTLNFTLTNLFFVPDMAQPGSTVFTSTQRTLTRLLGPLFKNTSVGSLFAGCRVTLLRPEKHKSGTRVDAVCTYRPDPLGPGLDREQLFWELSRETHGVTQLGFYTLDPNSLYVNGYNQHIWTPATNTPGTSVFSEEPSTPWPSVLSSTMASPSLVPFTLNFTIINLRYTEDMEPPGSVMFNTTERILNRLLKLVFQNSSLGPLYTGCKLTLLRPVSNRKATGVDAVCTYHPNSMGAAVNREKLYWELSQETQGVTKLGPFFLDRDSLYVNGKYVAFLKPQHETKNLEMNSTYEPAVDISFF